MAGMPDELPRRVLVVDDDALVRTFLRRAVERSGMVVEEAFDGRRALERSTAPPAVDLVLLDGLLPDMHGVQLARQLLTGAEGTRLAICFLTGAVHGRVPSQAGVGCLAKPVRPADLVDELRGLLAWRDAGGSPLPDRQAALRRMEDGFLVGP